MDAHCTSIVAVAKEFRRRASSLDASILNGKQGIDALKINNSSPIFTKRKQRERSSFHRSRTLSCVVETPVALRKDRKGIRNSIFVAASVAARLMVARHASLDNGRWVDLDIARESLAEDQQPLEDHPQDNECSDAPALNRDLTMWESLMHDEGIVFEIEDADVFGGFLLDFMHRSWVKMQRSHFSNGLAACIKCITHSDDTVESTSKIIEHVKTKYPVYSDIVGIACDERLTWLVLEDVIAALKKSGGFADGLSGRALFQKRAREIMEHKRHVAILKAEVNHFVMERKAGSLRFNAFDGPPMKEFLEDRHNRHQKFWKQFHAGASKHEVAKNLQATSPVLTQLTQLPRPGSSPNEKQRRQCWKTRPARTGLPKVSHVESDDSNAIHGSQIMQRCKSTPESRCSSAPSGDMRRPPSRASTSCQSSKCASRSAGFQEFTNFQDILEAAEKPKISMAAKTRVPRHAAALMKDLNVFCCPQQLKAHKSASLPNLQVNTPQVAVRRTRDEERPRSQASSRSQAQRTLPSDNANASFGEFVLPDADQTFSMPWYSDGGVALWQVQTNPGKYLRSCQERGVLPKPLPFMTGHSSKLQARGVGLSANDLKAISDMSMAINIDEIDLGDNPSLSDNAIGSFLAHLLEERQAVAALQQFSLKGCVQAGVESVTAIIRLLMDPASNLLSLDLSGMTLSTKYHEPLFQSIWAHPCLRTVKLADLGLKSVAVSDILRSTTIENIDFSWNCFSSEVFLAIGQRLAESGNVQSLSMSSCSSLLAAQDGNTQITPILYFIEQLAWDKSLQYLDISMNRLDFRGSLVIEDALESHQQLAELDISRNPLGVSGMRSLLRLLARDSSGLINFNVEHCNNAASEFNPQNNAAEGPFSMSNPAGRYALNLASPQHRTVLRMLYKICDRFKISPDGAFTHLHYSIPPYTHPSKDICGIWEVPTKGRLRTAFHLDCAMEHACHGIGEDQFGLCLEKYFELTRMKPGFNKIIPFCAYWKSLRDRPPEQEVFLSAVSKDFMLTAAQICELSKSHASGDTKTSCTMGIVHETLLSTVSGGKMAQYLVLLETPSLSQYVKTFKQSQCILGHNIDNPTGHYKLDLANPSCYAFAEQLVIIDQWESGVAQRLKLPDTSERGDRSQFRNLMYMERHLAVTLSEWSMAEQGELEFDYVSIARPKKDAQELEAVAFSNILLVLGQAEASYTGQVQALKQVAHYIHLTCKQLREMLGLFESIELRMEAFVATFLRIIDIWNEKVFRVRFEDSSEIARLQRRLGSATLFPFIQPEQYHFEYDFAFYDQRLAAHLMVILNTKENKSEKNLRRFSLTHSDGIRDEMSHGIPRYWHTFSKCPTEGIFRGEYACAPEDRNLRFRKEILEKYGYWKIYDPDVEIMWWAGVSEAPEDVVSYLEFLIPRFRSVNSLYEVISHGHGEINLREFEDSLRNFRCKKFAGPNESERIISIFRYLDPSGEGSVSRGEWGVLELLWQEIIVSMDEFKKFLFRTFHGNLFLAWSFFDADGSGEVDFDEWCSAVLRIRYFGPVKHTFRYIDLDDTGTIGWSEFQAMWERDDLRASVILEG